MWKAISVYIDNSVVFPGKLTKTSLFSNLWKHLVSSCYTCYVVVWVCGSMSGGTCGCVGIAVLHGFYWGEGGRERENVN